MPNEFIYENNIPLGSDSIKSWKLKSSVNYEYVNQTFKPLERFRPVEFDRDWNRPLNGAIFNDQRIAGGEAGIVKDRKGALLFGTVEGLGRFQDGRQKVEGFHRRFFDRRRNRINADRFTRDELLVEGFLREAVELRRQIDVQLAVDDGFRRRGSRPRFILDERYDLVLDGCDSRHLFDRFGRRRRLEPLGRPRLDRLDHRL